LFGIFEYHLHANVLNLFRLFVSAGQYRRPGYWQAQEEYVVVDLRHP